MSWFKFAASIWKQVPTKGVLAAFETDMLHSIEELRVAIKELTSKFPNSPFLFNTVFGQTYVDFFVSPSRISVDTTATRAFKQRHGFHGYYIGNIDNPVPQKSKSWITKQEKTDMETGID